MQSVALSPEVIRIARDIRSIKIQGARRIAKAALAAMAAQVNSSRAASTEQLYEEMLQVADALAGTRPTEPMMAHTLRKTLRFLFVQVKKRPAADVAGLKKVVLAEIAAFDRNLATSLTAIAEFGAKEIPKGGTVLIHCHSTTLMATLKRAAEIGRNPKVICTETRPKYQGHISAKELSDAGIDTTMIVDSGVKSFIHKTDLVMVGSDAITSTGDLINKIGTATLATVAWDADVRFYCTTESYKFDPLTLFGRMVTIEERDPAEVADPKEFPGVKIRNPSFDLTAAKYITGGYVTEYGVLPPASLLGVVWSELRESNPLAATMRI